MPEPWHEDGRFETVHGRQLHVTDTAAADGSDRTPLVILHGFPTASRDFRRVWPLLTEDRRCVIHDHLGFGLSAKPADYGYTLAEQADQAVALWEQLGLTRVHLLAHDYGTSVATELLARREEDALPIELASVTLCNGSIHIDLAKLTLIQRLLAGPLGPIAARLSGYALFARRIRGTLAAPDHIDEADLKAAWADLTFKEGKRRIWKVARYIHERRRFADRWIGALTRLDLPAHVLWGRDDTVAVAAIAEALIAEIPGVRATWLDGLGHYPMLEDAEVWARAVREGLDEMSGP